MSTTDTSAPCPFCDPPQDRVFATDRLAFALWDGYPASPGHALIIPERHMATWFEATEAEQSALFALLSAKQGLTEAELLDRFRQVEVEKASTPPKKCADCGRAVNQRSHRCLYCGAACPVGSAFELLELGAWPNQALQPTGPARGSSGEQGITGRPGG